MFILDLLGWWYSRGWSWAGKYLYITRSKQILQFFSISDLFLTLFSPFRQDVVHLQSGSIGLKLQALGNNIISRIFGFLLRLALIVSGVVVLGLNVIFATLSIIVWPLLPLGPLLGIMFIVLGVGNV